jgi:heme-degrading monooxygenase HmoA
MPITGYHGVITHDPPFGWSVDTQDRAAGGYERQRPPDGGGTVFARVSTYRIEDDAKLVEGFDRATGPLGEMPGFAGAYFLLDRDGGKSMSITLWDDEDALNAGVEKANELRRGATAGGGGSIESVDHYEVALTAGPVAAS